MTRSTAHLVAVALLAASPALAQPVVIDNGLAPPNPANVIDASNSYPSDSVLVTTAPTSVVLVDGGEIGGDLSVADGAEVTIQGGSVGNDAVNTYGLLAIQGGEVGNDVVLSFGGDLTMTGGTIIRNLVVEQDAGTPQNVNVTDGSIGGDVLGHGDEANLLFDGVSIGGDLRSQVETFVRVTDTMIGGEVVVSDNTILRMDGSNVSGDLSFPGWDEGFAVVTDTSVGGDLISFGGSGGSVGMIGGSIGGSASVDFSSHGDLSLMDMAVSGNVAVSSTQRNSGASVKLTDVAIAGSMSATLFSRISAAAGSVALDVVADDESSITLTAVHVQQDVEAAALAVAVIRNATVDGILDATETSRIEIFGTGFLLDGSPVGFGPLAAISGLLTGSYFNGDALSYDFQRDPTATIELVPEPSTGLLVALGLGCLAARRKRSH